LKIKWFILAALNFLALTIYGQQATPSLHKRVNLPAENLRFDLLLHLVTQQTGIRFSLNTQKFKPSRIIHVPRGLQRLDEILAAIRKSTGIHYTLLGDHIIFIDNPPSLPPATPRNRPGNDLPASQALPLSLVYPVAIASTTAYLSRKSIRADSLPSAQKPQATANKKRQGTPTPAGFFAGAGLVTDETFYINPSVQAGWPFLYGIVQWSSNFTVSGVRYGAGGSLRLSDKWQLGLMGTTGNNSKIYPMGFGGLPMTIKTSLQKISIFTQTTFSRHIQLQFGPVLNILSTNYYNAIGLPTPLFVSESDVEQYIKPPYTIQDTYAPFSSQNSKLWIGFQAGVFYSINFPGNR
jgi:hypothetical protein